MNNGNSLFSDSREHTALFYESNHFLRHTVRNTNFAPVKLVTSKQNIFGLIQP